MTEPIEYHDFTLIIRSRQNDQFHIEIKAPDCDEIETKIAVKAINDLHQQWREIDKISQKRFGQILYESLFTDEIRKYWDLTWAYVNGTTQTLIDQPGRIRIRLQTYSSEPELTPILTLPWEYLYEKRRIKEHLGLDPRISIVRYLKKPQNAVKSFPFKPPLQILGIISSATPDSPINRQDEELRLRNAVTRHGTPFSVEIDFVENATLEKIAAKLRNSNKQYHIIHFMGHGEFSEVMGEGFLLLEDAHSGYSLNGRKFARQLANTESLQLVFLNACESARMSSKPGHDPYEGVATALLKKEIPAVVAVQNPISVEAATEFASDFYYYLAQGIRVEQAMQKARIEVNRKKPNWRDWGFPVLYMQVEDGRLFQPESPKSLSHPDQPLLESMESTIDEPLLPIVSAIREMFEDAKSNMMDNIPPSKYQEAEKRLSLLVEPLLTTKTAFNFSNFKRNLYYFSQWENSLFVLTELLQEPLIQKYIRITYPELISQYESVAFGSESNLND